MPLFFLHVADVHLVDEAVLTFGRNTGLRRVRFVGANVIVLERRQDGFDTGLDFDVVVAGAVPGEQELKDERRDVRPFLDAVQQILANDLAGELFVQFCVEWVHSLRDNPLPD